MQYNITYREKDNSWQYIISYKDSSGKWKQRSKQGFARNKIGKQECKDAAALALDALKNELLNSQTKNVENPTFKEFKDIYLKHLKLHREYNTVKTFKNALNQFSALDDILIKDITNVDIQECFDKLVERKLAVSTIKFYLNKLSAAFNKAIKQYNYISKSPVKDITIPEEKGGTKKKALTLGQYNKLLETFKTSKYFIIFLLTGSCGLRIGEVLGLTWDNVNTKQKIIEVNKQWKKDKDGKWGFGPLKSPNSYRKIPLSSHLIKELELYKASHCTDIYNRIVINKSTSSLVSNVNAMLKKKNVGISIHEFRHTYATNLIANKVEYKTAAALLGHDVLQTMITYSHVTEDMFNNAANLIENLF